MSVDKVMERVCGKMKTLAGMHSSGVVQGTMFKKQIRKLLVSSDSREIFAELIEADRKAIKILNRLENPAAWRELTMLDRASREERFYSAIAGIMEDETEICDKLLRMLELACLPYYSSFLPLGGKCQEAPKARRTSRLSVLD